MDNPVYSQHLEESATLVRKIKCLPWEDIEIKSYDNKRLHAYFAETQDENAPILLAVHGWTGSAFADMQGGIRIALDRGMAVLTIDHRGHGKSQGHTITFGVKERKDVKSWCEYLQNRFPNRKVVIAGVSMGGATVLYASSIVPNNVVGVISDCPFDKPFGILAKVAVKDVGFPRIIAYPLIVGACLLYAHFNPFEVDASKEVASSKLPILLIHGNKDDFVPVEMARRIAAENKGKVKYVEVDGAPHAYSYYVDMIKYLTEANSFLDKVLENSK